MEGRAEERRWGGGGGEEECYRTGGTAYCSLHEELTRLIAKYGEDNMPPW